MHKNKVIETLKTFTPEEFKRFEKFVKSPYFNTSKDAVKLFDLIKKHYPSFDSPSLGLAKVTKNFNPKGQATTEARIRNILTELNALTRKFLSTEFFGNDDHYMKFAEICMLQDKKLNSAYKKEMENYFSNHGEINNFVEGNIMETESLSTMRVMDVMNRGRPHDDVEAFVISAEVKALIALDIIINGARVGRLSKQVYNLEYPNIPGEMFDAFDFEKFITRLEKISPKVFKLVSPEYYLLKIFLERDFEESCQKLKEILLNKKPENPAPYMATFTLNTITAIVLHARYKTSLEKVSAVTGKAIPFMNFFLENKLYKSISTGLPVINYISFLKQAMIAENYDWMKEFIEKYTDEVNEDKNFAVNVGKGLYYRAIGNYTEAVSFYSKASGGSHFLTSNARAGMMYCHYELKNYETALAINETQTKFYERRFKGIEKPDIIELKLFRKLIKIAAANSLDGLDELEDEVKRTLKGGTGILNYINKLREQK